MAGDVMLGRYVNELLATRHPAYPWGDVLPILREADLFLINLECAITAHKARWSDEGAYKPFYFRSDPDLGVPVLRSGRVDFASLANNHAMDFEVRGMLDTIDALDAAGIAHAGAGPSQAAAWTPARLRIDDLRVAVLACADHPSEWAAADAAPGIAYVPISEPGDPSALRGAVQAARQDSDLLVVSIHWGPNMRSRPSSDFRAFARALSEAGVDVLWGHSAHVVQGVEAREGRLILYDTGDFVDDYAVDPELRNDLSALFLVRVREGAIQGLELVPVHIGDEQVNLARGAERERFVRRFGQLCSELGTAVSIEDDRVAIALARQATLRRER